MKPARRPLYLDPDRYRLRRLMDAARLLPLLGAFLVFLPVLWRPGPSGHNTAIEGIYLFAVWAGLIVLARLFAPGLAAADSLALLPEPPPELPSVVPPEVPPETGGDAG